MMRQAVLMTWLALLVACPLLISGLRPLAEEPLGCRTCCSLAEVVHKWPVGNFDGQFSLPIENEVVDGWEVELVFSSETNITQIYDAIITDILNEGTIYRLKNKNYNADLVSGTNFFQRFQANAFPTPTFTVHMTGQPECCDGDSEICSTSTSTLDSAATTSPVPECPTTEVIDEWPGNFKGEFVIPIKNKVTGGWEVELEFTEPVSNFEAYRADVVDILNDGKKIVIKNRDFNADLAVGCLLQEQFQASTAKTPEFTARMIGQPECSQSTATEAEVTNLSAPYNYAKVLHKSILFYEAQRSGKLPKSNRIPWRHDSTLNDKGNKGEDLTGGWFDAGDYVKFGLPMASSATVLAWGLIEYRDAYKASGELDYVLDCIKWATDYFLKCHTGTNEFYAQVGNGKKDHSYWGRPEDMTLARPGYKVTANKPGSDVVGETAAALAAASIAFKKTDSTYANKLLLHAKQLYKFADLHRGKYSDAISDAKEFYESTGYGDELAWSAAWLYRATNQKQYLNKAKKHYNDFGIGNGNPWGFSWDEKNAGVMMLMYQLTKSNDYKSAITGYLDSWQPGSFQYTPKGLAFRIKWGSNRYAANTAFLSIVAADAGIKATRSRQFTKNQIHYMLGSSGRSYVVGFGKNSPDRPHHGSSSCPNKPKPCGWSEFHASGPNPHVLEGALVGGPDQNDGFVNDRTDYVHNEVTTDYNAGFQSAVAGLKSLVMKGLYDA